MSLVTYNPSRMEEWKLEYHKILSNETVSNEEYKRALSLKHKRLPSRLYKYFQSPQIVLKVIESELLLLKSPTEFNDPFECYEFIDDELVIKEAIKLEINKFIEQLIETKILSLDQGEFLRNCENPINFIIEAIGSQVDLTPIELKFSQLKASVQKSFKQKIDTFQNKTKMTCFSETNENLLMWGHYAKNHEGVCIEFDTEDWKTNNVFEQILFPVLYTETIFNATKNFISHYKGEVANSHYNKISWISKSIDWQYEKEWRIIMVDDIYQNRYSLPVKNISAIYLGTKINNSQKESLIEVCRKKGIRIYSGTISRKLYKIEFEQINVA
jgi:hypothetical protein